MSTETNRRRRNNLYKVNQVCPKCGVHMVLPEQLTKDTKVLPDNMCTLEHTTSRLHPDRRTRVFCKNIILCLKCNSENGRADELKLPIEELRIRSKMHKTKKT